MRNNAAGMAHEQESGMATHQFPIGQQIHEERGSIIKSSFVSFINCQICKSGVSRTLLLNAHFFRRHISTAWLPTGIFMYQNFNRSSRPRKILLTVRFFATLGLSELRMGVCSRKRYPDIPVHSLHSDPGR